MIVAATPGPPLDAQTGDPAGGGQQNGHTRISIDG
jgi:hypothetical protein